MLPLEAYFRAAASGRLGSVPRERAARIAVLLGKRPLPPLTAVCADVSEYLAIQGGGTVFCHGWVALGARPTLIARPSGICCACRSPVRTLTFTIERESRVIEICGPCGFVTDMEEAWLSRSPALYSDYNGLRLTPLPTSDPVECGLLVEARGDTSRLREGSTGGVWWRWPTTADGRPVERFWPSDLPLRGPVVFGLLAFYGGGMAVLRHSMYVGVDHCCDSALWRDDVHAQPLA